MPHSIRLSPSRGSIILQTPSGQDIEIETMATLLQFLRNATRRANGQTPRDWREADVASGHIKVYDTRGREVIVVADDILAW